MNKIYCGALASALMFLALPLAAEELIVWGVGKDRGLDAALRQFEVEHPGWKVVTSSGSSGGMDPQKLMCGIAGGSPPDMLSQDRFSVGEWAVRDAFLPLDEWVARSLKEERLAVRADSLIEIGESEKALGALELLVGSLRPSRQLALAKELVDALERGGDGAHWAGMAGELRTLCEGIHPGKFFTACWEEASFGLGAERRVFAIPNSTDNRALYYNEDLLERAGLVDEVGRAKPPRDWEELAEYAVRLTERDAEENMTCLGFAPNYGNSWLYIYGWLNGGQFMSADGLTCTLADPRIAEALTFMVEVYDSLGGIEKVDAFQSAFQSGEFDPFFTGKVAMKVDGNWTLTNIADYAPNLRFGVVPAPAPAGKESITGSGDSGRCSSSRGGVRADSLFEQRTDLAAAQPGFRPVRGQPGAQFRAADGASAAHQSDDLRPADAQQPGSGAADQGELPALRRLDARLPLPTGDAGGATAVGRARPGVRKGGAPHV